MIKYLTPIIACLAIASPSFAISENIKAQLARLTPEERLEQRCDIEAMEQLGALKSGFAPDRVVSYTFSPADVSNNTVHAKGAAFRSKGQWFRLKYKCTVELKTLDVTDFEFDLGEEIPRSDWQRYYLYD